jgi:hypothetical protein
LAENDQARLRHIFARGTARSERFTSPGGGPSEFEIPLRDRLAHGQALLGQLDAVAASSDASRREAKALGVPDPAGIVLSFRSEPENELALASLEAERSGIRLLSVKDEGGAMLATVFVPDGKLRHFTTRIEAYRAQETRGGNPKNQDLVASISEISKAVARHLWTDEAGLYPESEDAIWWEVWVRTTPGSFEAESFRSAAEKLGLRVGPRSIAFVDRMVLLAYGTRQQIERSVDLLDMIAELRRAKDSPRDFLEMPARDQKEWAEDLRSRLTAPGPDVPAVCLLDSGVNHGHPLLQLALAPSDVQTCDPRWLSSDHRGHGTEMAGLALYGDLQAALASGETLELRHRLESVKLIPPSGQNDPELYGALTAEAVARAEVQAPQRPRSTCLTVCSPDGRDRGVPSSWSSELDALAYGGEDDPKRLLFVAAGNVARESWIDYPASNQADSIHDPGQAWNALTVGAFTELSQLDADKFPDWTLLAHPGSLSPSSTTSLTWGDRWPVKPDLVLEGGNVARDPSGTLCDTPDDLSLLTTYWQFPTRLFCTTGDTSAATAQAARMGALLLAEYPDLWPETTRALLVHSASWTDRMLSEFPPKRDAMTRRSLVRCYGFGVPDVSRALWSLRSHVTLIAQDELQPFQKEDGSIKTASMNLHSLPWPTEVLRDLAGDVRMRVTLSYFVEPSPARRAWKAHHPYRSHGLRFAVKGATESVDAFRFRINRAARSEEDPTAPPAPKDRFWILGPSLRDRGSVHSDIWEGPAADLAERGVLAVYPVGGWWKERPALGRWERPARYALVVSIATPETTVDLYTPIEVALRTEVAIPARPG